MVRRLLNSKARLVCSSMRSTTLHGRSSSPRCVCKQAVKKMRCQQLLVSLLAASAWAEDVLVSRRFAEHRALKSKRQTTASCGEEDPADTTFNITFYHINDVHAHLDQFSSSGTDCTNPSRGCYGGYARVKTVLDNSRPNKTNSLFLNAGDEFQGTLFYNFYKGWKTAKTLNQLGVDAMTLGNHEFDGGDDELAAFINNVTFPILSANLRSADPTLNQSVKPYTLFTDYGLAVIGVTTAETGQLSNPGNGTTFTDATASVQAAIDQIKTAHPEICRIVALTHIGYEEDILLAQQTTGLSLIIGGHSHTLLGNMTGSQGAYPTIETNPDGDEVFIVTAYRWGEYLGYVDITYDVATGAVIEYRGAPVHLTNSTKQDEGLQAQINAWREPFEEFASEVVGSTSVYLGSETCQEEECLLGDVMADAMLVYRQASNPDVDFVIINAGGIRAPIDQGDITRGEVLTSFPFGNAVVELEYTGQEIQDVLEGIVSEVNQANGGAVTSFLQLSSGIRVVYNPDGELGSRLVNVTIGDAELDPAATYTLVTLDYLAGGGDNFFEERTDYITLDLQADVLVSYLAAESPIDVAIDGRITAVTSS